MTVASSMVAVCVPDRLMHLLHASMAAQPSTAFRFSESTRSNGGDAGDEAKWSAWRDCRQTEKQVQDAWWPLDADDDRFLPAVGRRFGVADGRGKLLEASLAGVGIWLWL